MSVWTDERKARVKELWLDGKSAAEIAFDLNCGVSRNAVIGQVYRMGLSRPGNHGRALGGKVAAARRVARLTNQANMTLGNGAMKKSAPDPLAYVVPTGPRITILELNETTCRWPLGEPGREGFGYCGATAKSEGPYCPYHARAAYAGIPPRKKSNPEKQDRTPQREGAFGFIS